MGSLCATRRVWRVMIVCRTSASNERGKTCFVLEGQSQKPAKGALRRERHLRDSQCVIVKRQRAAHNELQKSLGSSLLKAILNFGNPNGACEDGCGIQRRLFKI